jgi:biotin transport system substrate-specific component
MELIKQNTQSSVIKSILIIFLGSILLAISSKIKIPFYPVPMTMQTLVVLAIGIGFGWKLGVATISLYLFEGMIGLPVFSGTPEKGIGLVYFTGPTMGYLIGFVVAAFFAGFLKFDNWTQKSDASLEAFLINFIKLLIPVAAIYFLGILWLSKFVGWDKVLLFGLKPFWLAELFKILILSFLIPTILKLKKII